MVLSVHNSGWEATRHMFENDEKIRQLVNIEIEPLDRLANGPTPRPSHALPGRQKRFLESRVLPNLL